ncbi:TonB-dependent receptor [Acinetobacter populi]|uniref:TonB-dependent receptor n=1 Tax=Acinetobacter populi TaxID=1582270 RepID=A0A1Z9YXV4_9GAMM|nr:TonB-dependent receptor [Acinetobacter populi]OUY07047.1 TonB-dependent receptor [Acinetobacter populi]
MGQYPYFAVKRNGKSDWKLKAVSLMVGTMLYSSVLWAQETTVNLDLAAQPLHQAVDQLARQGNIQILYASDMLENRNVSALSGQYTVEQALQRLLQDTDLSLRKEGQTFYIVKKGKTPLKQDRTSNQANEHSLYQMSPIVVHADEPIQFGQSVLTQKAIDRYQVNNVAQLLDNMPSVSSTGSPRPGGQTINILGMQSVEDVPITLDDSVKTFDKYRQGSVFIEPEILKQVTVDKGPHNVEVGNGGFGGKVTLETKDVKDLLLDGKNVGAFLKYSRFSNNDQNTYTGAAYAQSENGLLDGLLYYTKRDSGEIKRPDGSKFLYSAQDQDTYMAKLNFYPTDEQKISLNFMQSGHNGWEPFAAMRDQDAVPTAADIERYGYDEAWKRRLVYRDQEDTSYSASYEYDPTENPYINIKAVASYSKTKQHDKRLPTVNMLAANLGNESWVDYSNTALKITNLSDLVTNYGKHKIKVGFQYQKMEQNSLIHVLSYDNNPDYNYGYFEPNFMPAGEQKLFALFLEDQYQINKFTITPSLRYDHITNQGFGNRAPRYSHLEVGQDYSSKTYTGWSPRLALAWQQAEFITWFANFSKTWRAPRVDEQYYVDGPTATVPSTSLYLLPEKMLAIRLGNEMNFDDLFTDNDHLQIRLTYYDNRGSNEIFRNRSVFCQAQAEIIAAGESANANVCNGNYNHGFYRNITDYTIKGYEAEMFYNHPLYFAGITYSYIRGQRDNSPVNPWFSQKTWIEEMPPRKATATLGFNLPQYNFTAGWRGIFVDAQDRSILNTDNSIGASGFSLPRTKGYALHHLFAVWQPISQKPLTINFGIDNVFNRDYKMYLGEYMTGTGRDYKLSVSYQF